jgi:hypothetical protein
MPTTPEESPGCKDGTMNTPHDARMGEGDGMDERQRAIEALANVRLPMTYMGIDAYGNYISRAAAEAILDAIERGEVPVPGMVTAEVWRAAEVEVARLTKELAEERAKAERFRQMHTDAVKAHADQTWSVDAEVERLRAELADWRDAADSAENPHPDEVHCACVPLLQKAIKDLRAEVDRLDQVAEDAETAWESARSELAALKGRKVRLPAGKPNTGLFSEGWNACITYCAKAFRAAGIEVEGA